MIIRYIDNLESRRGNKTKAAMTKYFFKIFMRAANSGRRSTLESRAARQRGRSKLPAVRTQDDLESLTDHLFGRTPSPVSPRRNDLASRGGRRRNAMAVGSQAELEKLTRDLMTV